jgi:hypothetical protein
MSAIDPTVTPPRHTDIPARLRFEARDHRDKMDSFAPVHTGFLLKVADEFEAVLSGLEGLEKAATAVSRQGAQGGFQWVRLTGELLHARALLAKARGQ